MALPFTQDMLIRFQNYFKSNDLKIALLSLTEE